MEVFVTGARCTTASGRPARAGTAVSPGPTAVRTAASALSDGRVPSAGSVTDAVDTASVLRPDGASTDSGVPPGARSTVTGRAGSSWGRRATVRASLTGRGRTGRARPADALRLGDAAAVAGVDTPGAAAPGVDAAGVRSSGIGAAGVGAPPSTPPDPTGRSARPARCADGTDRTGSRRTGSRRAATDR
ncbi:hypothetical protein [Kitasatospora sp. NPDC056531]|uniref:hypothetical protein n=1 Tax=Kitasatospora sp. NPDC056531 TaxID=3345856 RepID=UPI0036BF1385